MTSVNCGPCRLLLLARGSCGKTDRKVLTMWTVVRSTALTVLCGLLKGPDHLDTKVTSFDVTPPFKEKPLYLCVSCSAQLELAT